MGIKSAVTVSLVEEARGGPFVFWHDLIAACSHAEGMGFDAIEVFAPSADAVDVKLLHKLLDDHGLKLAALGTGGGWVINRTHLAMGDAKQRQAAKDFIRSMIDLGGKFGCPAIIGSMQGRSGDGVDKAAARAYLAEALNELGEHAEQYGEPLLYEPLNRYESEKINLTAEGVELVEELETKNVKLLCDMFHMAIEEVDIADALRKAGDHIGHVHFADSNRRAIGMGHTDVRPVAAVLKEIGYDGYASAEVFPLPSPEAAARQTITAFRYWFADEQA